jgi:hypothetical protein
MLNALAVVVSVRVDQMIATTLGTAENAPCRGAAAHRDRLLHLVAVMAAAGPGSLAAPAQHRGMRRLQRVFRSRARALVILWRSRSALHSSSRSRSARRPRRGGARRADPGGARVVLGIAQINWFIAEGRQRELMAQRRRRRRAW